jgi:hypothetical protein
VSILSTFSTLEPHYLRALERGKRYAPRAIGDAKKRTTLASLASASSLPPRAAAGNYERGRVPFLDTILTRFCSDPGGERGGGGERGERLVSGLVELLDRRLLTRGLR